MAELQQTVQRGNSLLQRKEEQLQQLESSIAKEVRRSSACIFAFLSDHLKSCTEYVYVISVEDYIFQMQLIKRSKNNQQIAKGIFTLNGMFVT